MIDIQKLFSRRQFFKIGAFLGLQFPPRCSAAELSLADESKHHTADGFRNYPPLPPNDRLGFSFFMSRIRLALRTPELSPDHFIPEQDALDRFHSLKGRNTLTWLGQSTFLFRIDGKTILTDPFFAEYADPLYVVKRFQPPGITLENLPDIDVLLVSHNHRDHLDEDAVEKLLGKDNIQVFVPLKLKPFFAEKGYPQVNALDWHESVSSDGLKIVSLPTVHNSGRGLTDKDETLWCAWSVLAPSGKYFFTGDTAYSPTIFKKIGTDFGPFAAAIIPIGTYDNRKFGINNHINPEEAVEIGREIKAGTMVGMHWGTLDLSEEPPMEPPERFREAARKAGIPQERIWVMKIGETREFK